MRRVRDEIYSNGMVGSANLKTEPTEQRGRLEMDHAPPNDINGLIRTEISV